MANPNWYTIWHTNHPSSKVGWGVDSGSDVCIVESVLLTYNSGTPSSARNLSTSPKSSSRSWYSTHTTFSNYVWQSVRVRQTLSLFLPCTQADRGKWNAQKSKRVRAIIEATLLFEKVRPATPDTLQYHCLPVTVPKCSYILELMCSGVDQVLAENKVRGFPKCLDTNRRNHRTSAVRSQQLNTGPFCEGIGESVLWAGLDSLGWVLEEVDCAVASVNSCTRLCQFPVRAGQRQRSGCKWYFWFSRVSI